MPIYRQPRRPQGRFSLGGQGGAAPNFTFATLYRLRRWRNGQFESVFEKGRFLPQGENPAALFVSA